MAQFYEDWSGATLNSRNNVTGWARRFYTAVADYTVLTDASEFAPAGRSLEINKLSSGRSAISLTAANGSPEKCEVAALISTNIPTSIATIGGPMGRGSGTGESATCVVGSLTGHTGLRIIQYNAGDLTNSDISNFAWSAGTPYWVVLRLDGTTATQELRSAANPNIILHSTSWTPTLVQSGWLGIFNFTGLTVMRVLCWCAGTGEDRAPIPGLNSERQRSRLILTPW